VIVKNSKDLNQWERNSQDFIFFLHIQIFLLQFEKNIWEGFFKISPGILCFMRIVKKYVEED